MKKLLLLVMAVVMVGCAGINWNDRVGVYTYEQAVIEYGSANAVENLNDGRKEASWVLPSHLDKDGKPIDRLDWRMFDTHSFYWDRPDKLVLTFGKDGRLVSGGEKR